MCYCQINKLGLRRKLTENFGYSAENFFKILCKITLQKF